MFNQISFKNQSQLTLPEVKSNFIKWRSNPENSGRIPNELWDEVFSLLPSNNKSKVLRTLGISTRQLTNQLNYRAQKRNLLEDEVSVAPSFVKAVTSLAPLSTNTTEILLTKPNGTTMQLRHITSSDLLVLINHFAG